MSSGPARLAASDFKLLHEFFSRTAQLHPDAIALDIPPGDRRPERRSITYAQLSSLCEQICCRLLQIMHGPGVVAILLPRDTEHLYAAQIASMQAGAAYICIEPTFPNEQVRQILEDSGAEVVVTDRDGSDRLHAAGISVPAVIDVLTAYDNTPSVDASNRETSWLTPDTIAYIIYTSGTTGRPKGVEIRHRSIVNLVRSDITEFALTPTDRVAQGSSPAYDSSVEEIWLALSAGACVVVMDDDAARLGPDLVPWLQQERITVLCPPPTLLRSTGCDDPERLLPNLRLLYVGGEALTTDVVDRWASGRRLVNGYGPTECTVTALRADVVPGRPISIGAPVPGLQAWILDDALVEVETGISGELCLSGENLAAGYRSRPDLTAEKFVEHPSLGRIYRTGDLVHRDRDGQIYYQGRIDSQIKLRGFRIELEAIETCLARYHGVREAACRVQGEGARQMLAAHIVPLDADNPPDFSDLKFALRDDLPVYMVPDLFGVVSSLPKSVSGKLKRDDLPDLEIHPRTAGGSTAAPRTATERKLSSAMKDILGIADEISITEDFFGDLGGNSLQAARLISRLRDDAELACLTVRDVYEARCIAELTRRIVPMHTSTSDAGLAPNLHRPNPARATLLQSVWLVLELMVGAAVAYLFAYYALPWAIDSKMAILLMPLFLLVGFCAYAPLTVVATVVAKRTLIGKYRPRREPVWGGFYVRYWIVKQVARSVPWVVLAGTEFQCAALRALGARIGKRVHIHRGVNLADGGWDLLTIGDDVTLCQDAMIGLIELEDGCVVSGPVTIEDGATLDVRAGVGPHTVVECNSWLTALSSLPAGGRTSPDETWDGIPARPKSLAPSRPVITHHGRQLSPFLHGCLLIAAQCLVWSLIASPWIALALLSEQYLNMTSGGVLHAALRANSILSWAAYAAMPLPFAVTLEALLARSLGRIPEGTISKWSVSYIRVWIKVGLVDSASEWLSGSLFWPYWLRLAGMKIGRDCEISTIIDVVPEMVSIGASTFCADGIYLAGPRIQQGVVTLAKTSLRSNTFLGNHVVIPAGQHLPDDILLGVCTVSDDQVVRQGSSWFGLPPFELPRREIVDCDASLTHNPTVVRYVNRLLWESARFTLPIVPVLTFLAWLRLTDAAKAELSLPMTLLVALPATTAMAAAGLCLAVLALKWMLLGRVKPGTHPLWSCWCSRWDFLYVAWGVWAGNILSALEGTLLLNGYLRLMGINLGKRVVLGPGFSQVVDPDMLIIGDDATVNAMFQAHTFEDRVLKIDYVHIAAGATLAPATVPLYGAEVGERAYVAAHSVIMKRERLLPGLHYEGAPTKAHGPAHVAAAETAALGLRVSATLERSREEANGIVR